MKSSTTNQSDRPASRTRAAWLGLIPALLILCLAVASKTESSPGYVDNTAPQLEGSWLVTVTLDIPGVPPIPALVSYTAGGVVMVSDPSVYPTYPMTTAYHGTWARKGGRDFVFTFMGFVYDNVDDGAPDGLWKLTNTESVTLEPGGDEYNGKGTLVQHAPDGSEISYDATTHGTRIKAE